MLGQTKTTAGKTAQTSASMIVAVEMSTVAMASSTVRRVVAKRTVRGTLWCRAAGDVGSRHRLRLHTVVERREEFQITCIRTVQPIDIESVFR